jgi:hypothetical protein
MDESASKETIHNFQNALIVACFIGMGGQRRQVIGDFTIISVFYNEETDFYYARLSPEKTNRRELIEGKIR